MGKPTGFKEYTRELPQRRPVAERICDFREIYLPFPKEKLQHQAARCMDCGVPTCHAGCPLGNRIPDWNDMVYHDRWQAALIELLQTNNFPEFTGRLCPAPCEEACVLAINEPAVTIEQIEREIIEQAFEQGWIKPRPPKQRTGKKIAIIGSGPAGLACAQQLNSAGHLVTVFEREDCIGGLLRYGIPEFKLEKKILDRRLDLMQQEGIQFKSGVHVGVDLPSDVIGAFNATVLCTGSTKPRDLSIEGRDLAGIHFAMEILTPQNRLLADGPATTGQLPEINARDKHVVVIGGGDTGSDCVGTCHRQGARSVVNFELMPKPPEDRSRDYPWPFWPLRVRTSSSHEEGGQRHWRIETKRFIGKGGQVSALETVNVTMVDSGGGRPEIREIADSKRTWPADLVLLALGFTGPETHTIVDQLGLALDPTGTIQTDENYATSRSGIFAAGDANRGQSLIVWAISEGREAAHSVDRYLMGQSVLPTKGCCDLPRL